jgi:hypothetical protein
MPFTMTYHMVTKTSASFCGYAGATCFIHHKQQ